MWIGPDLAADRPIVLGKYRLVAELGHGGMGDVYLATAKGPGGFNTLVVLKRLRNFEDPQHRAMFLDEARLARRLFHPNIVQTYEVGQEEGNHFIVMEYLAGPTLQSLRRSAGLVPAAMEIEILCNVLEGLHYAHELKSPDGRPLHLVHRDLCAENVIVTGSGESKILDFGVAKIVDSIALTQSGFTKGKLRNMPREQLLGQNVDRRADIFAAGVMLWEGLTGRPMWGDIGDAGIASRLTDGDLPSPMESETSVAAPLREICARALNVDPAARFPDALAFKDTLVAYMNQNRLLVSKSELAAFVDPLFVKERERLDRLVMSNSTAARGRPPESAPPPALTVNLASGSSPWGPAWSPPVAAAAPTRISSLSAAAPAASSRRWIAIVSLLVVALGIGGLELARRGFNTPKPSLPAPVQATPASTTPPLLPSPTNLEDPSSSAARPRERARTARPTKRIVATPPKVRRPVAFTRRKPPAAAPKRRQDPPPTWSQSRPALRNKPPLDNENPYGALPAAPAPRPRTIDRDAPWATPKK